MTIYKQYLQYNELKAQVLLDVGKVNRCSILLSLFGVICFSVLLVFFFSGFHNVPISCKIGFKIAYNIPASAIVYPTLIAVIAELLGFVCTSCYMILGGYIMYYKSLVKVDSMKKINSQAFRMMIIFCILGLIHSGLAVMCSNFVELRDERFMSEEEFK